jgi:hypothetical protein
VGAKQPIKMVKSDFCKWVKGEKQAEVAERMEELLWPQKNYMSTDTRARKVYYDDSKWQYQG